MRDLDRFLEIPLYFSESSSCFSGKPLTAIVCGECPLQRRVELEQPAKKKKTGHARVNEKAQGHLRGLSPQH